MKAEHRKELQTNVLADRMGRLMQGMKSGPKGNRAVAWVITVLTLLTVVGWYAARGVSESRSALWVQLDSSDPRALNAIAEEHPGTIAARTARFQDARQRMQKGIEGLLSPERDRAFSDIEQARKLYEHLVSECAGDELLAAEALLGWAQAEETLVGVPKQPGDATAARGDLDRARNLYEKLVGAYPESFHGRAAQERLQQLTTDRARVEQFYAAMRDEIARLDEAEIRK